MAVDAQALAQVQAYCGWHVAPEVDETITLDGSGASALLLPSLHVVNITKVTEDGVELDPAYYTWSEIGVVRRRHEYADAEAWRTSLARWTFSFRGVVVEYTHGFDELPADLLAVVEQLADRASAPTGNLASKTVGPFTETYRDDLGQISPGEASVLSRYKLPKRF